MNSTSQQTRAGWITSIFAFVFGLILVLLPVHAFLSTWLGTAIGPLLVWKSWKELLLFALLPLFIIYGWQRPDIIKTLWRRRVNQLVIVYALLHLVLSLFTSVPKAVVAAGLLMNLRFFAMFVLAQLITESHHPWAERYRNSAAPWLLWTALGLGVLAIIQITVVPRDFLAQFGYDKDKTIAPYIVVDQNPTALRAFATMRGPNTLGEFLVLPLTIACFCLLRRQHLWLSASTLVIGSVALIATESRGAWLGFGISIVVLLTGMLPRGQLRRALGWSAAAFLVMTISALWLATVNPGVRLAIFHSRADRPSLITGSTEKHAQAIIDNSLDALTHPLGEGPGAAGPASFYDPAGAKISEDYFIQIAQEVGILGLLLFVAVIALVAIDLHRQEHWMGQVLFASLIGLIFINLLSHGWADDPTAMTWWGVAGLYYYSYKHKQTRPLIDKNNE